MAKDIVTKAEILGGEIDVRANFGQTVKVTVSPDPYMGDTEVTPSAETQVLATKKKFVQDDITVYPAPTESLLTTVNGTFTPSSGKVGFSQVDVDVQPDLRPLSVSENGTYEPDGFDGFSQVSVDVMGIIDSLLEVVSSVTPEQDVMSARFTWDKKSTGRYIIVSNPPGTRAFANQQTWSETINMVSFEIRGVSDGEISCPGGVTTCYRKNPSTQEVDWWTTGYSDLTEDGITISPTQGRYPFLAGVTYYLLRVKGA